MKRILQTILLLIVALGGCLTSVTRADTIDEKVDRVFVGLQTNGKRTLTYSNGAGITHADLKQILYVQIGQTTLLDKGVSLVDQLETRESYSHEIYMKSAAELNEHMVWAAVGAPGVDTSVFDSVLGLAKKRAVDTSVQYTDKALPGIAYAYEAYGQAYGLYGKVAAPVKKYKAIKALINGVVQKYSAFNTNEVVKTYFYARRGGDDDAQAWDFVDGRYNIDNLQKWVNTNYPNENWFSMREFCRSAWRLNQIFTQPKSGGKTVIENDINTYVALVKARVKVVEGNRLSVSDASVQEGNRGYAQAVFTLSLPKPALAAFRVRFSTEAGTATNVLDFTPRYRSTVVFPIGQTRVTFSVSVRGDRIEETDETFAVNLEKPDGVLVARAKGTATIKDDDFSGEISSSDISFLEGNSSQKSKRFSVSLSKSPLSSVVVNYATQDGSAKAGEDYTSTSGQLVFLPNQTLKPVSVSVLGDATVEANETFSLVLTSAYKVDKSGTATILNDDIAAPTPTPIPSQSGKIAFVSAPNNNSNNSEVHVVNADGTNETSLTNNNNPEFSPCFSPDGNKIAFISLADGIYSIFSMNSDGSNQKKVLDLSDVAALSIRSDGKIEFVESNQIFIVNDDGSGTTRLTSNGLAPDEIIDGAIDMTFSADGSKIAFSAFPKEEGSSQIYIMNVDGSNRTRLTNDYADFRCPCFRPDGSNIAFYYRGAIGIMNANGSNQHGLVGNAGIPLFSPDGNRIAYANVNGVYSMLLDGSDIQQMPVSGISSWAPGHVPAPPTASPSVPRSSKPNPSAPGS